MNKNDFERLQPGQVIQNKKDPKWVFIVHQNFGDRLIAVRTIEIRNSENENWETPKEEPKPVPHDSHDSPELKQAAHDLHELLKDNTWYHTIGIGYNMLVIYTNKKKYPQAITEFGGYPVTYRYVGKITI